MTKLVAALILVALLFCVYGVKELVDAHAARLCYWSSASMKGPSPAVTAMCVWPSA
jgi:hypothetical protein